MVARSMSLIEDSVSSLKKAIVESRGIEMNWHEDKLLTIRESSERLRVSSASVYILIKKGKIIALRVGSRSGAIRIRESDLTVYLESCVQFVAATETTATPTRAKLKHISLKPR